MAWSKAGESTNAFIVGTGELAFNNIGVIQDYIDFLVTRGWVVARTAFPAVDAPTDADRNWYWYIYKIVVCEEGGTSEWGYRIRYHEDVGGSDEIELVGWDRGSELLGSGNLTDAPMTSVSVTELGGKWSFWQSDLDGDSLFVMGGDGVKDQIFGFWPPAGTMYKQGGGDYNLKTGGLKLITINSAAYGSTSSYRSASISLPFGPDGISYLTGMNTQNIKLDACVALLGANTDRRLFASYGGDLHSHLSFSKGFQINSTNASFNETNVYLIDGRYYIAWGYQSSMLFDCGETAPVF